jgi:zinc protease
VKGLVVLCLASCATFGASPPPAPPRATHLGLEVERFELMNGLRVVLVGDPSAPEIEVTMRYAVGGVDEPVGQDGIAHLVEHLMYQQVLGSQTLFAHLEGATSYFNGATTYDATTFVARANLSRLDELLSIEAVRAGLRCTSITDSVFEREREVVINELRERSDARALRSALHRAAFAGGHPYRVELGGSEASVAAITRAQACAFADAHYAPNNAVLVVSGNLTAGQLQTALKKFLTHIARREITAQVALPPPQLSGVLNVDAPVDRDAVVATWTLPADPLLRVRVRALADELAVAADLGVRGRVELVELGDTRAPMLGLVVFPAEGESVDAVKRGLSAAIGALGVTYTLGGTLALGQLAFDRTQQHAIYRLFASLEPGSERDTWFAAEVLAGRDPSATLAAEFRGLRELQRDDAPRLLHAYLTLDRAQVTVLKASGPTRGRDVVLATTLHDLGRRREPPDPALAHVALVAPTPPPSAEAMRTRVLPNGMRVVLLPLTNVPTVDARIVFATGTADEPSDRRGVALLAADTLTWDYRYLNDLLTVSSAGGDIGAEVGFDHTAFIARGLDMYVDYLLAGLRRVVREGRYDPRTIAAALHRTAKRDDDDGAITDAWRAALYGPGHPYVVAGVVRHMSGAITRDDLESFRAAHYLPANATLVIAGHFDADLAERWIDYLFGDWTDPSGRPELARGSPRALPHPLAVASYTDTAQVSLLCAFPATGPLAERLVVTEMLSDLAADVRHQLGASYALAAHLDNQRLASEYVLDGFVETGRAEDAVKLLAERIAALRDDPDTAARAFVIARARVVTRLRSLAGGATALAVRVERDTALGRPPLWDLETARATAALTVDQLTPALAQLDLSRALLALRGPEPVVTAALAALGRTATVLPPHPPAQGTDDEPATTTAPAARDDNDDVQLSDIQPAITEAQYATRATASVAAGYTTASTDDFDLTGFSVAGQLGYRLDATTALGLHLDAGYATTDYSIGISTPIAHHVSVLPVDLAGYVQGDAFDRVWGEVFVGLHVDHFVDSGAMAMKAWQTGAVAGLAVGLDVYRLSDVRLSLYARVQGVVISDTGFSAVTAGLAVRR